MTEAPSPPGWYPDPANPGGQRWWTGAGWTDHVAAPAEAVAPAHRIPAAPEPERSDDSRVAADHFDITQRFKLSTNVYQVSANGQVVAWVRQKIMALKERIELWTDESQSELLCVVQARKVMDLRSAYDVLDGAGVPIAVLRKVFGRSLLRSTWSIETPAGEPLALVTESSMAIAITRRVKSLVGFIPFIGWALELVPLPYGFTWTDATSGAELGRYRRILGVRDRYQLDLPGDPGRRIDRRAAVALAICLDALQSR